MRVHLLAILLVLATGTGALYYNGFFDTWHSKKDALKEELAGSLDPSVPEEAKELLVECVAEDLLTVAQGADCPLSDEGTVAEQLDKCLQSMDAGQLAGFIVIQCIMKTQAALEGKQGAVEE